MKFNVSKGYLSCCCEGNTWLGTRNVIKACGRLKIQMIWRILYYFRYNAGLFCMACQRLSAWINSDTRWFKSSPHRGAQVDEHCTTIEEECSSYDRLRHSDVITGNLTVRTTDLAKLVWSQSRSTVKLQLQMNVGDFLLRTLTLWH